MHGTAITAYDDNDEEIIRDAGGPWRPAVIPGEGALSAASGQVACIVVSAHGFPEGSRCRDRNRGKLARPLPETRAS